MLSVRKLVFAGALLVVAPFALLAEEKKVEPKAMPPATTATPAVTATSTGACGTPAPAPCAPATVKVWKMVPTQVEETRTVMKPVQKTETYTAYKYETVQEKKTVNVTTYKTVTETVMENRTTTVKVPVWEEKTVNETRTKVEWVTEMKEKCKLSFVKECKTIGGHGGSGLCGKPSCGHSDPCADPCASSGCGNSSGCGGFSLSFPIIKPTITKECVPVCVKKCTTECVPVTKKVCTYKCETKTECVPVCKTKCVPVCEAKEVITCKKVCVPYQATRCVTVCEPVCEKVMVCKMVSTCVEEPAPAASACGNGCGSSDPCATSSGCGLFSKLKACLTGLGSNLHSKSCGSGCGSSGIHINLCSPCGK